MTKHTNALEQQQGDNNDLLAGVRAACAKIAPAWPLDRQIAVNPYWNMRDKPIQITGAWTHFLSGAALTLPEEILEQTPTQAPGQCHQQRAQRWLEAFNEGAQGGDSENLPEFFPRWHNYSDFVDKYSTSNRLNWQQVITDNISLSCVEFFTERRASNDTAGANGLYRWWLATMLDNTAPGDSYAMSQVRADFDALPEDFEQLILTALGALKVAPPDRESYCFALLMSINGWASWVAYEEWQAKLSEQSLESMQELLAVRLAWDWVLSMYLEHSNEQLHTWTKAAWQHQLRHMPDFTYRCYQAESGRWLQQTAAELALQEELLDAIKSKPTCETAPVELQAVFCIDVRSEVIRRHLEAQSSSIQTFGFAGFFGLPVDHDLGVADRKPLLPGLLAPKLSIAEISAPKLRSKLAKKANARELGTTAASSFALVEAGGMAYAWKLLRDSLGLNASSVDPGLVLSGGGLRLADDGVPLSCKDTALLAAGVLRSMGLTEKFASTVLLVGHGANTTNNPQAAALNCGACCGNSGAANVRLLAGLLNRVDVRSELRLLGITIPNKTVFVPALHDTVTDEIHPLDGLQFNNRAARWLEAASANTRLERSSRLGVRASSSGGLLRRLRQRGKDWSQVRPEWGLANNAAFIVGPREQTRQADLGGRAFLHDYNDDADPTGALLESILTAPMVVTHWINMQYNASVTAPHKFGSGNKVLHNVVGGNVGVLEGAAGDLRTGLSLQSVHDGDQWMHSPLRLSVFVFADADKILAIYHQHEVVRQLVDNEWLYLLRVSDDLTVNRLFKGGWENDQ